MRIEDMVVGNKEKLKKIIDSLTFIYLVSIYVFAGGFEHWVQSYSNLIALVYIFFLVCYAYCYRAKLVSCFSLLYIPFLVLCGLSAFWTLDRPYCIKLTIELSAMFVLSVLMYNYFIQEHKIRYLIDGLYIGGICLMCGTVLYYGIPEYFRGFLAGDRMGHILGNLNDVGVHSAYSALIALYYCLYKKKWLNIIPAILLLIFASGTGSRKVVAFLIAGIFLLIFCMEGWKSKIYAFAAVVGVILIYLFVPLFEGVMRRVFDMVGAIEGETDGSTSIRIEMIKQALIQFRKTPLFGIGLGSSHVFLKKVLDFNSYSHNNYAELLIILGGVGFIFWYVHYLFPSKVIIKAMLKHNGMAVLVFTFVMLGLIMHIGSVEYQERFQIIMVMIFYAVRDELINGNEI